MNAKDYLNQVYWLEQEIQDKMMQLERLEAMATKMTSSFSGMRVSGGSRETMQDRILNLMEARNEMNRKIDEMVDTKLEIAAVIQQVENPMGQRILEKRYLCFRSWPEIFSEMQLRRSRCFEIHREALKEVADILNRDFEKKVTVPE